MKLKERLQRADAVLGTFVQLPSAEIVELAALAGLEFVILDNEHGPIPIESLGGLMRAAELRGAHTIVRVAQNDRLLIQKALDLGAQGILVPQIATCADAEAAVSAARFAPLGARGACPCVRSLSYGADETPALYERANDEALVILSLEGAEAIRNVQAIASVPGVDAVLIGPVDLSHSLGVPGQPDHPKVKAAIEELIEQLRPLGVAIGVFSFTVQDAARWAASGVRLLPVNVDATLILSTFSAMRREFAEARTSRV